MSLNLLATKKAPGAIGPYSQGVKAGNIIYTSAQLPFILETGELLTSDIQEETRLCLEYLKAILEEGGASLNDVVKVNVYITDMNDFGLVNEVYGKFFTDHKPARCCVEVSKLAKGANIEIDAVAIIL